MILGFPGAHSHRFGWWRPLGHFHEGPTFRPCETVSQNTCALTLTYPLLRAGSDAKLSGDERISLLSPTLDAEGEGVDAGDLPAFRFKTLPTQEFLVREQAIEENLYTSFTLFYSHFQRHNRLSALVEALAAKRLLLHRATQDAVDLPKMVQVVCRFQADELLDRLPSAYLVDPIALHPPCARD